MFIYSPLGDQNIITTDRVSVEIDGLDRTAVLPALEHASELAERISNLVTAHSGRTYEISSVDYVADFDEATRRAFN